MATPTYNLSSGFKIPVVGFGTFTITDEKELVNALNVALETGYRHIDTAYLYQNEHIIGSVLKEWFDSGKLKRDDIFITTKLPPQGVHPDRVEKYITQSLERLQLDYVDLYLIHIPICMKEGAGIFTDPEPTDLVATWKKLEEQVDLGRTKSIGISNFNKDQVSRIIANSRIKPASNQVELHAYLQQTELVKYCQDNDIVLVSYFSLGNPGLNVFRAKHGMPADPKMGRVLSDPIILKVAEKHNKSAAQVLLKFLLQKNIALIPKSITPSRIKENFKLFDFKLDTDDVKIIEGLDKGEEGRLSSMLSANKAVLDHPEFPFPKPTA